MGLVSGLIAGGAAGGIAGSALPEEIGCVAGTLFGAASGGVTGILADEITRVRRMESPYRRADEKNHT